MRAVHAADVVRRDLRVHAGRRDVERALAVAAQHLRSGRAAVGLVAVRAPPTLTAMACRRPPTPKVCVVTLASGVVWVVTRPRASKVQVVVKVSPAPSPRRWPTPVRVELD